MGIFIDYSPVGAIGGTALLAGYGKRRDDDFDQALKLRALQNQEAQQAQNAWMQQQNLAAQNQRHFMDMQRQAAQNMQDNWLRAATLQRQYAAQDQINQRQQNQFDQQLKAQEDRQQWMWEEQGADALERQIAATQGEMGKLTLTPEGQAKYRELSGKLRGIQAARAGAPPQQYAKLLAQWADEFDRSGVKGMTNMPAPMPEWAGKDVHILGASEDNPRGYGIGFYRDSDGKMKDFKLEMPQADAVQMPDWSNPDAVKQHLQATSGFDERTQSWYQTNPKTGKTELLPVQDNYGNFVTQFGKIRDQLMAEAQAQQKDILDEKGNETGKMTPLDASLFSDEAVFKRMELLRKKFQEQMQDRLPTGQSVRPEPMMDESAFFATNPKGVAAGMSRQESQRAGMAPQGSPTPQAPPQAPPATPLEAVARVKALPLEQQFMGQGDKLVTISDDGKGFREATDAELEALNPGVPAEDTKRLLKMKTPEGFKMYGEDEAELAKQYALIPDGQSYYHPAKKKWVVKGLRKKQ